MEKRIIYYNGIYKEYNICDYYNILPEYKKNLKSN